MLDGNLPRRSSFTASTTPMTEIFGKQCLMARRLAERGVRMVQVYHTQTSKRQQLPALGPARRVGGRSFQPIALPRQTDRRAFEGPQSSRITGGYARGLGRGIRSHPTAEGNDGREHHPFGFHDVAGRRRGETRACYGATDEFGWHAVENKCTSTISTRQFFI